ncbi:MAG: APC family permease [Parvibaculum sp.]
MSKLVILEQQASPDPPAKEPDLIAHTPSPPKPALARRLNLPLLVLYGLGVTVGAGIYVLIGEIAGRAGMFTPYAFLFAGLIIAPTTYSFSKLVARFPVSAGEARYVEEGFQLRPLGILVGLLVASAGIVSSATISVGSVGYVQSFVPLPAAILVSFFIVSFTGLAILGIKESVIFASVITIIEVGALLVLIGGGFWIAPQTLLDGITAPLFQLDFHALGLVASASALAFYAFIGFEDMVNVAEEVKAPERTFPPAILITLIVTLVLYFLIGTVAVTLIGAENLSASATPISVIGERIGFLSPQILSLIAAVSALNGILIQMIMSSRVLFGLARQSELPAILSYVHPRRHTPIVATLVVAAITLTLALAFPLSGLAEATSRITFVIFSLVNTALVLLTLREAGWLVSQVENKLLLLIPTLGGFGSVALLIVSLL